MVDEMEYFHKEVPLSGFGIGEFPGRQRSRPLLGWWASFFGLKRLIRLAQMNTNKKKRVTPFLLG